MEYWLCERKHADAACISTNISVLYFFHRFSLSALYYAHAERDEDRRRIAEPGAQAASGGWSRDGSQRKLTRRERTPAEAKENTLVKYKGYSRHCNRVISRNPFPRASRRSRMRVNTIPRDRCWGSAEKTRRCPLLPNYSN